MNPTNQIEVSIDNLSQDEEYGGCANSEPFALRVLGDSMEPEFREGHVIVIDPSGFPKHDSYVLAEIDGEFIFRQLKIDGEKLTIVPTHGDEPSHDIERSQIKGVIVQRAGTRRKDHKHYD